MQMQTVRIAVLRQVAWLAPFGGGEVEMLPFQPCGFTAPAWHHDQEPGEVTPHRLAQPVSRTPEACQFGQRQIVRASLGRPGAAATGDQCAGVGLDVPGVLCPIEEAGQAPKRARALAPSLPLFSKSLRTSAGPRSTAGISAAAMPSSASLT